MARATPLTSSGPALELLLFWAFAKKIGSACLYGLLGPRFGRQTEIEAPRLGLARRGFQSAESLCSV